MARIVIDGRIINSSTGRYVERLVTYLEKIDKTNEYIVLVPKKDLDYWKPSGDNFTVVECNYKNYSFGEQFGFVFQLYRLKADLVHFCMPQQPLLYRRTHVTTMHDLTLLRSVSSDKNYLYFKFKQFIGSFVWKYVGKTSTYIMAITEYTRKDYLNFSGVDEKKVITTILAADQTTSQPEKIDIPYKNYLMYLGRQGDHKNIKRLILAHQKLLETYPDLGLVLVGKKNQLIRINEQWVDKNKYKQVLFTGFLSDEQAAWLYAHARVYVFPSLMEGFGLPGLEAMLYGAPVVSSDATCLPEVYGDAALYFNPKDVDDMAEKITKVLDNKTLRATLISKGYKQVKKYSWTKMAQQTLEVYTKALGNSK